MDVDIRGMQQFVIPQFIDNEDHVIGPVTTRQFLILLAMGLAIFVSYKVFLFLPFLLAAAVEAVIAGVLAFMRPNGRPFHYFLLNLLQTFRRPALRVWKKQATFQEIQQDIKETKVAGQTAPTIVRRKPMAVSRLSELSLVVDTGGVYRGEANDNP